MNGYRIDDDHVFRELKRITKHTKGIAKRLGTVLKAVRSRPNTFSKVEPPNEKWGLWLASSGVTVRKAKLREKGQDYRLIFLQMKQERVCVLISVFPRCEGYNLNWDWIAGLIDTYTSEKPCPSENLAAQVGGRGSRVSCMNSKAR